MVFNLRVLIFISSIVLMLSAIGSDSTENKPRPHLTEPRPHLTEPRPQSKKPRLYHQLQTQGECELVSIPMCQRLGYNLTATPNAFLHSTQHEAALEVHQFWPLLQLRCSKELRFFLCASYAPVCVPQLGGRTLPVCRQVCRRVRTKCEPFMKQHSFRWPQRLECSLLPRYGDNINREQLCVDNRNGASETVSKLNRSPEYEFSCLCKNACQSHPLDNLNMDILNQNQTCRKECYSALFSSRKRSKAVNLTMSFAVISGVTSLFTIVTFLLNRDRYQYPQRPIVFMAVNQMIVTVAYALRALAGHANVLCPHKSEPLSTTESPLCLATFALTQYGSTGVHVWWLIASMCWLAATTFQWAQEAISRYCRLMHTVGVAIPAIYTGLALVAANKIDWDTLLGMCVLNSDDIFINNNNKRYYLLNKFLWISPQLISVPVGGAFMLAALISMRSFSTSLNVPVVSSVRNNTLDVSLENSRRLRGLSRRLAVFVTLYVATSSIQLACTVIEHLRMFCTCSANSYQSAFIYAVLISQHVSKLAVGPVCATWMASRKTIRLWWYFLCCQQHKEAPGMQERVVVGERLLPVVPPGGRENPAQRLSVTDSPVTSHTSRHTLRTSSHKVNSRCSRQVFGNL